MSRVWLDVYADEQDAEAVVRLLERGKANQAGDDDPIPSLDWGRSWDKAEEDNAEPTAHEETRARQTGATVSQLRAEQRVAVDVQVLSRIAQWLDHKREAGDTSYELACQLFGAVEASSGRDAATRFHDNLDQDLTEDEEEGKR